MYLLFGCRSILNLTCQQVCYTVLFNQCLKQASAPPGASYLASFYLFWSVIFIFHLIEITPELFSLIKSIDQKLWGHFFELFHLTVQWAWHLWHNSKAWTLEVDIHGRLMFFMVCPWWIFHSFLGWNRSQANGVFWYFSVLFTLFSDILLWSTYNFQTGRKNCSMLRKCPSFK